jgi:hypothetical protein
MITLPFVTFEVIDDDWTTQIIFNFDEKDESSGPAILN